MNAERALRRLSRRWRGATVLRRLHATPAKTSYLVGHEGERFVLRVDAIPARRMGLDRAAEFTLQSAAAAAGLAPQPVAWRAGDDAVYLTRYAAGEAWDAQALRDPAHLRRLASLLRRLHALPVPDTALPDLAALVSHYGALAGGRQARSLAARARRLVANSEPTAICHHDAIAGNVVGWRRSLLIDWEYAALGDPLFDLAVVLRHHLPDSRRAEGFLKAYFGPGVEVPRERLRAAGELYDLVLQLWLRAVPQLAVSATRRNSMVILRNSVRIM